MRFELSGGADGNTLVIRDPSWDQIEKRVHQSMRSGGDVGLEIIEDAKRKFDSVDVRGEGLKHILTCTKHFSDVDEEVYSLIDLPSTTGPDMVEIFGDYWGAGMVGNDPSLVLKAFKEFFETGEIDLEAYGVSESTE